VSTAPPAISVIICAYTDERWENLVAAVASVRTQTLPALETILVIDGNDGLERRAREAFPDALVLANAHERGLSGARRTGAERARGDVLAFIDDDAAADPDWLAALAGPYADPNVLGVGGLIDPDWEQPAPAWFPPEFNWVVGCTYAGMPVHAGPIRNPIGANMSMRSAVLARTGSFDPRLGRSQGAQLVSGAAEETEFCLRASRLHPGRYWIYEPAARVHHAVPPSRATWRYFVRRCWVEGAAKATLRHLAGGGDGLATERRYVRVVLPLAVARDLWAALRGRPAGLARGAAIIAGLAITTAAYVRTLASLRRHERGNP